MRRHASGGVRCEGRSPSRCAFCEALRAGQACGRPSPARTVGQAGEALAGRARNHVALYPRLKGRGPIEALRLRHNHPPSIRRIHA